jgi:DNA-binding protein H-NS
MTKSYSQIMKQIGALQAEAEAARKKEVQGVVERIRAAISAYGLTAAELGFTGTSAAKAPKAAAAKKAKRGTRKGKAAAKGTVKYRDEQGRGWVGIGKRPQWLRDALAGGKKLEDFLVK